MSDSMCPIHEGDSMRHFEKDGKDWWSHKLNDGTWCNGKPKKIEQATYGSRVETKSEDKATWDAKDRQSIAQTAMKSASEIVAALINSGLASDMATAERDVKQMANEFYIELKRMKSIT